MLTNMTHGRSFWLQHNLQLSQKEVKRLYPVQLVFVRDMILPIKHKLYWKLIRQWKQRQVNKNNIRKNIERVDHEYKVRDKVIFNNHASYKYEIPYMGQLGIMQCWNNDTANLQYGATKIGYNIRRIKPYKSDTNIEDFTAENFSDDVKIWSPVMYFCIILNLWHKVYSFIRTGTLT